MNASVGPARVLLTTDAVGGIWQYTMQLARALSRRRVEVEIAVVGPGAVANQRETATALRGVRLHETGLPLDWTAVAPDALDLASRSLAELAQRLSVDIVQLHTPALVGHGPWHAPVLAVIHSCVGTWWSAVRGGAIPASFGWQMNAVRAGLEAANCAVAPTRAFAEMVRSIYGLPRELDVVHNGRASAASKSMDAASRHGILTAGRLWDEGKGAALLDSAASMMDAVPIRAAGPVVGPNGAGVSLERVQVLGTLDERAMTDTMAEARIFASPARYEPFGLAVLEAAQSGLPLILADIPTFRELWDGAAIFLPPKNAAVWAGVLSALHERHEACHHWGMKARARAGDHSVERFDNAMWETYCRMLAPATLQTAAAA